MTLVPEDGQSEIFGVHVSDMQSDVIITDDNISGALQYVSSTQWVENTWVSDYNSGYYLTVGFENAPEGAYITDILDGSDNDSLPEYSFVVDEAKVIIWVGPLEDDNFTFNSTSSFVFKLIDGNGIECTKTYTLDGLTLNALVE